MFQFLVISFKESVKDYRVYLPWDPQVTAEVWTMTFKKSSFICTPCSTKTFLLYPTHHLEYASEPLPCLYSMPHAFMPVKETGIITDLRACLSLHTNFSHIYYVPSKQYCIFFCPHLKKRKNPNTNKSALIQKELCTDF